MSANIVRVNNDYKIQVVEGGQITLDTGSTGSVLIPGNATVIGDFSVTGNYYISGSSIVDNIEISGDVIQNIVTNNDLYLNTVGTGVVRVQTSLTVDNDLEVAGKISVSTVGYESQVLNDNDIPNKKWVDDTIAYTLTFASVTGIANGDTSIITYDNSTYAGISKAVVNINSVEVTNFQQNQVDIFNLRFSGTRIETTISNEDFYITVPGTGKITLQANTEVEDNLTVVGNTTLTDLSVTNTSIVNDISILGNATVSGGLSITGNQYVSGVSIVDNVETTGNTIQNIVTNNDLNLNTVGTGVVRVQTNLTVDNNLVVLGDASVVGDFSVTGNYYISGISVVDNIEITGNTIQNIVTNNDLNLTTVGTGVVRVQSDLTVDNNLIVTGNLTVNGSTTTVNSTTLTVDDKNIELAATTSPTDALADGGGITLRGTTDKTILYNNSNGRWETNIGLTVGGALSVTPANASVTLSPTGTGTVTVNPATAGSINNVNIGASTRGTGAFTTLAANSTVNIDTTTNNQSYTTTGAGTITITSGTAGNINNMNIGATTRGTGAFTTLAANGNVTLGDADTDTITVGAAFVTGTVLRSAKADTNTLALAAYDVDGTVYTNLITLTASNTPTLTLTSTGVGSINNMNIGASTRGTGAFTSLDANGNVTLGDADTDTITVGGAFVTGTVLRSAKSNGNTLNIAAYDVDGSAYTNLITLTASNTPTIAITSSGVGSIDNINIGSSTRGTGAFTTLAANGNVTLGDADTDTITVGASFVTGTVLRSAKADTNTLALAAYDVDGAVYTNLITLTASNTPTLAITSTGVGSINNMNIGASTRGTGAFTTLDANSTVTLSPANTTVTISPSGTGSVTIAPATTLTLGTSGQTTTMNGTTITMANATGVAINGANPTISSTSTGTLTLFNANIATVDAFQAATSLTIGATTGTMTLRNATVALSGSGTMATQGTTNDSITRKDYVDSMAIAMTVALSVL